MPILQDGAKRCNDALGIGLTEDTLIKTTRYRVAADDSESELAQLS